MDVLKRKAAFELLDSLKINYTVDEHPAAFTIDEIKAFGIGGKGEIIKNLFLRDDKGKRLFLVCLMGEKRADLSLIREQLCCTKLGFACEEKLQKYLGQTKGSVSPLGVGSDSESFVEIVLDSDLACCDLIGVHPNDNTATVWLKYDDLLKVLKVNNSTISIIKI
ncbi:MAG: prolyl-tRNA synthetase associated domain-containing protein [Oscillospiraceae bacterium]